MKRSDPCNYLRPDYNRLEDDAANLIIQQEIEITKLRHALTQIAEGNEPLTVMRSVARQALNKK